MSDLETVARFLGPEYHGQGTYILVDAASGHGPVMARLDPDQELGAILRRASETDMEFELAWDGSGWYVFFRRKHKGYLRPFGNGTGSKPHLAARAAVCKLMEARK
jgi:hypothetical protein